MFSKDFYPTPGIVINRMILNIDLKDKVVFEPSSGKGDILKHLKSLGAKTICCEVQLDLAEISSKHSDRFLKEDFFDVVREEVSHIDYIIMNPPFNNADKHILHAWDVAPEGCQIIALCNWETINNDYYSSRKKLNLLVKENGTSENLGNCFSEAERETEVNIGLVNLFKPKTGSGEFEGYFDMFEEVVLQNQEGIMPYNAVKDIVNRYVEAVKRFDNTIEVANELNNLITPITTNNIRFGAKWSNSGRSNSYTEITRDVFKKELQISSWTEVFKRLDMGKYITSRVMEDVNKFVEKQTKVPFTMSNVYKMFEIIMGTHESRMNGVVLEMFDWLTHHHYDNRFHLEGWKTNIEYIVNRKFIAPYCGVYMGYKGQPEINWNNNKLDDFTKSLCYITATNFDNCVTIYDFLKERKDEELREWGKWYTFNFLEIKIYKKGTVHCKFIDEKVWERFNQVAAKEKGFQLASKFTSDFRTKPTDLVKK